jgi:hypothetical protein
MLLPKGKTLVKPPFAQNRTVSKFPDFAGNMVGSAVLEPATSCL